MAMPASRSNERSFDRTITEGPILSAVWKLAWPTMLQNVIGGMQGMVDHIMVGHYVGFVGNAAIGVSWQIYLVVVVFISSLFTGMAVLVARFAGRNERSKVNRTVYQAFVSAVILSFFVLAPLGYFAAPSLLNLAKAAPEVQAQALPYLRIMLVFSFGSLMFYMLGGALRSAGDARTPLRLGVVMTGMNVVLNVILIRGLGPIPGFGTTGAAMGTVISGWIISGYAIWSLSTDRWVVAFERGEAGWLPEWSVIRELLRFGLPAGLQGVAMNAAGVFLYRFIGSLELSAQAQAVYAVGYTELFSFITWSSNGLMGAAAATAGQNLGAGQPDRSARTVKVAGSIGLGVAVVMGVLFLTIPRSLMGIFGLQDPVVLRLGAQLLRYLSVSGLFVTVALAYTGGLQGTGDTKSPLYISVASQIVVPLGMLAALQGFRPLHPSDIWLAIVLGHVTRCVLSVVVFRREKWRNIEVEIEGGR